MSASDGVFASLATATRAAVRDGGHCVYPGCGLPFESRELPGKLDPEALGRANTPAGPMHFACHRRFRDEAYETALDILKARLAQLKRASA